MNNINPIKGFHEFHADSSSFRVIGKDGREASCIEIATKIERFKLGKFSNFEWIQFHLVDFLSRISFNKRAQYLFLTNHLLPTLNAHIEKTNRFIDENYQCSFNTVECLEDADIICLGDYHDHSTVMENNAILCSTFAQGGDLILEEYKGKYSDELSEEKRAKLSENGLKRIESIRQGGPFQLKFYPQDTIRQGWDKLDWAEQVELFKSHFKKFSNLASFIAWPTLLDFVYHRFNVGETHQFVLSSLTVASAVLCLWPFITFPGGFQACISDRNEHMINRIEETRRSQNKQFVIAGAGHFDLRIVRNPDYYFFPQTFKKETEKFESYLRDKKAVVLIPKIVSKSIK